jgi:hypothetical protein
MQPGNGSSISASTRAICVCNRRCPFTVLNPGLVPAAVLDRML